MSFRAVWGHLRRPLMARCAPPQPSLMGALQTMQAETTMSSTSLVLFRGFASKKHKSLLKYAKGYRGRSKNCFRVAIRRVHKAWQYAYRDRRRKKRLWRRLWIQRIQAGVRQYGTFNYSRFVPALAGAGITLNRKVLAEMAANEPFAFKSVLDVIQTVNPTSPPPAPKQVETDL